MKSFKAQPFTVPVGRRYFLFNYSEPRSMHKRAHTVENGMSWMNPHSASESQQLLILAPLPQNSSWQDERGHGSHPVRAALLGGHAYLIYNWEAWCCWAQREKRRRWITLLLKFAHGIMFYKVFFTSIFLFEPPISHWRYMLLVPYHVDEEIVL